MEKEILLPKISDNIETVIVTEILVSVGDTVDEEDSLVTVESEKASLEVPTEFAGTVKQILVKEGDEVRIGAPIIILTVAGDAGNEAPEQPAAKPEPAAVPEPETAETAAPEATEEKVASSPEATARSAADPDGDLHTTDKTIPVSPLARKVARELGVNLKALSESTDRPRITVDDVKAYAGSDTPATSPLSAPAMPAGEAIPVPDFSQWGRVTREKISSIRRITAKNTSFSWQTMPHVTQFDQADITELEAFRKAYNAKHKTGLTVTAILLKMMGVALQQFPKFNSSLDAAAGELVYKHYYHIGVAADTKDGLLMPVVQNVETKGILELSMELSDLAEKARNRKLLPEQMTGQTFVISNLGGIGGTAFTPVVFPNNCAILGVSRAAMQPVYNNGSGAFEPRLMAPLCVSYDHRVIDGAEAARFLRWVCEGLEQPIRLLF